MNLKERKEIREALALGSEVLFGLGYSAIADKTQRALALVDGVDRHNSILREALERIAELRETGVTMKDGRRAEAYLSDAEAIARDALFRAKGGE